MAATHAFTPPKRSMHNANHQRHEEAKHMRGFSDDDLDAADLSAQSLSSDDEDLVATFTATPAAPPAGFNVDDSNDLIATFN